MIQVVVAGVEGKKDQKDAKTMILGVFHRHGVNCYRWTWRWLPADEVTDDDGNPVDEPGVNVTAPGLKSIREKQQVILDDMSATLGVVCSLTLAPVEAAHNGKHL